jgi:3-hydroxyisobutyrate dehydrogenase
MNQAQTVAVLGAGGIMGRPMAANLCRAGIAVRAWNRSPDKAAPLRQEGAEVVESPAHAAQGADIVLTMLADTDAVLESVTPALEAAGPDALWLQMSTVGEEGIDRCLALARSHGIAMIDAPVLGTKQPAQDGALVVLASGPEDLRERAAPVFDAVGAKTIWVGEAGAGTRLKLVANSWVLTVVEGVAETFALAQGLGLDPRLFLDAIAGGGLDLPYLRLKATAILAGDFDPNFSLRLAAKDARLVDASARAHDLDLPLFATIAQRLSKGAQTHGEKDMSATYLTATSRAAG